MRKKRQIGRVVPQTKRVDPRQNPETAHLISSLPFSMNGYTFTKILGSGSFSVVFQAHHNGYNRDFAAKFIPLRQGWNSTSTSLESEVDNLRGLSHPNIIKLYSYFYHQNHLVLILQLCKKTVKNVLCLGIPLQDSTLRQYMASLIDALLYSHIHHVAHRDIKTANLFIDELDRVMLADFGFSYKLEPEQQVSEFCGTLTYRAPEVIEQKPHDPFKSDVWSLGVAFYIMATGQEPWNTCSFEAIKNDILNGRFEIPDTVPEDIASVIKAMLTVDPVFRPSLDELSRNPVIIGAAVPINKPRVRKVVKKIISFKTFTNATKSVSDPSDAVQLHEKFKSTNALLNFEE